ncbi:hypothetical protein, partial [Cronobacter sakazakii]
RSFERENAHDGPPPPDRGPPPHMPPHG